MSRDRARSLRRRLRKAEVGLPVKSPEQRERERRVALDYDLHFMQTCFVNDGFKGLARYWRYRVRPETSDADLLDVIRLWARRFKATNEQLHAALLAAREGLDNPICDEEEWSEYWWGGPSPTSGAGRSPSRFCFDDWIKTDPPRWEVAVALDLSRMSPMNAESESPIRRPHLRDIEAVDEHFNGPRTRRHKAELERIRRELGA